MKSIPAAGLWLASLAAILSGLARADWLFLPASRHQQFLTFGLFTEEQTTLVFRDHRHAWAAIGDSIALVEASDLPFHPQLVISGSVNVSFRENSWLIDFLTETFDARFGLAIEGAIQPNLRFSIGASHFSGHAADSIQDQALVAPNLGDDILVARVIYDFEERWRIGATFKPNLNTDPAGQWFGADQFAELFPFGSSPCFAGGAPYLAVGLDEGGLRKVNVIYHAQLGLLYGNHFHAEKKPALRLVFGYYSGPDPRLKYAQLLDAKSNFFYGGVMIDL